MNRIDRGNGKRSASGLILALVAAVATAGCGDLLDVENPNQLLQDDLERPEAAGALANGALATVTHAYGWMTLVHGAASDELQFVGSRDAWVQLQEGNIHDENNEFTDQAWPSVTRGRWMADEAVRLLKEFDADGLLGNRRLLARAQLYSAMIRTQIADLWEDFVISDRDEAGPPIGKANMQAQMYDHAISSLDEALGIAQAVGDTELQARILAQRARTKHARAVWGLVVPDNEVPDNPLVSDEGASADAAAALGLVSDDWRFRVTFSSGTVSNNWGAWVNERLELRISNPYVIPTEDDKEVEAIRMEDPIDEIADPALTAIVEEAVGARQFNPVTVVSARELRLILAEAALADGDDAGFAAHINAVRSLDDLSDFEGQMDAQELLEHMRRVNLFNTGRRLLDHYRFDVPSVQWAPGGRANTNPGTLFPITSIELRSNCHMLGTC